MELKGSKTEANLMAAFAGESRARNKYTFYAAKAEKDGYKTIGDIFTETAENEREHREIWLKIILGGDIPDTLDNLKSAAAGELNEAENMYPNMAKTAKEEGFDRIAKLFEAVGRIEKQHQQRYSEYAGMLEKGEYYQRPVKTLWICTSCGHLYEGEKAPTICPVCGHNQGYYRVNAK